MKETCRNYYKECRENAKLSQKQAKKQTTIRLPVELKKKLQQEADRKGISFNAMIVSIFDNYINHQE